MSELLESVPEIQGQAGAEVVLPPVERMRGEVWALAWPVILTGMRVSTLIIIGIAAIAAYVNGPGLGEDIFTGLSRIGSAVALNLVLGAVLAIIALALLFDGFFTLLGKLTTSRGLND